MYDAADTRLLIDKLQDRCAALEARVAALEEIVRRHSSVVDRHTPLGPRPQVGFDNEAADRLVQAVKEKLAEQQTYGERLAKANP